MTETTFDDTIDWNHFWRTADDEDRAGATPSAHHVPDLLAEFVAERGVPDSVADVGCGPGVVTFDVADRYPETTVVGYDAAESILEENRDRARTDGVANVRFERTVLPEFDPEREFDLVCCYGTLCYVADTERALRRLYDAVAPGGVLVMGYVNSLGRAHYNGRLEDPDAWREAVDPDFDPERFAERFRLVLEGESTLSYRRIHDALGTWPRSFWEVTDRPDEQWAWRHVPLVWVPK